MTQGRGEIVRVISNPPSVGEQDIFLSLKSFLWGPSVSESNSFVPIHFFSYPEITQYPESIFLLSSLLSLSSSWLRKWSLFLFQSKRKKLRKMKADWFLFFFLFLCEGNEMKNRSAMVYQPLILTQWPATYPKQLQVSP